MDMACARLCKLRLYMRDRQRQHLRLCFLALHPSLGGTRRSAPWAPAVHLACLGAKTLLQVLSSWRRVCSAQQMFKARGQQCSLRFFITWRLASKDQMIRRSTLLLWYRHAQLRTMRVASLSERRQSKHLRAVFFAFKSCRVSCSRKQHPALRLAARRAETRLMVLVGWKKVTDVHHWFLAKRKQERRRVFEYWHAFTMQVTKVSMFRQGRMADLQRQCLRGWRCRSAECAVLRDAYEAMRRAQWSSTVLHAWHSSAEALRESRRFAMKALLRTWCALSSAGRRERWVKVEVFRRSHAEKLAWTALRAWSLLPTACRTISYSRYSKMRIALDDSVTPRLRNSVEEPVPCKKEKHDVSVTISSVRHEEKQFALESDLDKAIHAAEALLKDEICAAKSDVVHAGQPHSMSQQSDIKGQPEQGQQQSCNDQDVWECFLSGLEKCEEPVAEKQPSLIQPQSTSAQKPAAVEKQHKGNLRMAIGKENQVVLGCSRGGMTVRPSEVRSARGYTSIHSSSITSRTSFRL
eukprot:gnl/MRDRNA2_/MRDRNA2_195922_c0_seq1.p1 gnl/MRDRNA2_/MRDRNA2_195922_c0~~gnl/MRDRNA2_/MRDRNA2_195922_c0_seq1.p1  ORF type:complete len:522 (+),score=82.69 gnl/MRDRNA2_/MRDRNA2_195922_c0_seq1:1-1566(+)